jgi:hypothetical protein
MKIASLFSEITPYYDNSYYSANSADAAANGTAVLALLLFMLSIVVVTYIISSFLLARIFKKAGVAPWKAWVPVYNNWVMLELGEQQGFWAVLALIPIINIVAAVFIYLAMYNIGLKLGKDGAFVLLAIFLPLVWLIWLAFDHSTWNGTTTAAAAGISTDQTTSHPAAPKKDIDHSAPSEQ